MKKFGTVAGAERNVPFNGLILKITDTNGEVLYLTHLSRETKIEAFTSGAEKYISGGVTLAEVYESGSTNGL